MPTAGLEPAQPKSLVPKTSASTNSARWARLLTPTTYTRNLKQELVGLASALRQVCQNPSCIRGR